MEMKEKLIRSCTLNDNVQDLLLEYLRENDEEELNNLLEEERIDVNYVYKNATEFYFEDRTALQIACAYFSDNTSEKCIQLLLDYGADIFYEDPITGKNSLIFAAESGNHKILETILKHIDKKRIDISNSNVIYSLIKFVKDSEETEENFDRILKLLLEADIDINYEDAESGWTTIYLAAKYKFKNFVQTIIDLKKNEINLDEFKDRNRKSARDLIIQNNLYVGQLPDYNEENSNVTIKTLYKNIRNRSIDKFRENFESIQQILTESDKYELLTIAVKHRLEQIVKFLLNKNVEFEKCYKIEENPLVIATQRGFHKIVKLFMFTKPNSELTSQALFALLKIPYTAEHSEEINYQKCLTLLLKSENLDINARDNNDNTALHYSLRYQDPEMSLKILRKGATLASKDSFNRLAVQDIDSLTLETHLNECIQYENEDTARGDDACLLINFTTLLPSRDKKVDDRSQKIPIDEESQKSDDLSSAIEQLSPETEVLQYLCTSKELRQHLKHPVILAFLYLKWHRIRIFFYINLALYMMFIVSLLTYITLGYNTESKFEIIRNISYVILTFTFILLVVREISQLFIFWHRYFFTFDNWLEIVLLVVTGGILTEHSNEILMRQLSAIAIVAAAIEFLLLVGQFPAMSTNIMMLRTVSYTFFKLLLWYSILLFAFAYSFYTLFQETETDLKSNSTIAEDEDQDFFEDPGMSLLKTIVMLTGEFDAASIRFSSYPIISHFIFVMFVFLIAIVLFNLLNGLAVSDTQVIKNDAELYGQILRVEHIAHIERVLLKNRIVHWLPSVRQICLFPLHPKKAEILVYPNQNSKIMLMEIVATKNEEHSTNCFKVFFNIHLDKKIEREIILLMKEKKEQLSRRKREDQLLSDIAELRSLIYTLINKQ